MDWLRPGKGKADGSIAIDRLRKRALEISPDDYVATTWLQVALRKESRFAEAIEVGEKGLEPYGPTIQMFSCSLSHAYLGARNRFKCGRVFSPCILS